MKTMRISFFTTLVLAVCFMASSLALAETKVTTEGKAGDTVTIEGTIEPGQELYIAIAQQDMFKPADATMPHEKKKFAKETEKQGFGMDTAIPPLYYVLTSNPNAFGKKADTKFGGPSIIFKKARDSTPPPSIR